MNSPTAKVIVVNVVGLTHALLGKDTPNLNGLINEGYLARLEPVFPAVTCTAQASMLTGLTASGHGIVGNGWYFRDLAEVGFWKQSNYLVKGQKIWDDARRVVPGFECSQLFWWYNMYAAVDHSITPRPYYPADGRKIPALYSNPADEAEKAEAELGPFPFFNYWGPAADERSSAWIAQCAKRDLSRNRPALQLVYLPHLDYNLQRLGPGDPRIREDVRKVDEIAGDLIDSSRALGYDVLVVSEYGIGQVSHPVHINRILREAGYVSVRRTPVGEMLDFGASRAFAVADHQIAHVYVRHKAETERVRILLCESAGVDRVLSGEEKKRLGVDHERSGELVAVADVGAWFTYYYWFDDDGAPDFARTVDIHRKPGYDPVELFIDPQIKLPRLKVAGKVLKKKLGFRTLMDVIPLDAGLVRGSHGRLPTVDEDYPVLIGTRASLALDSLNMTQFKKLVISCLT